MALVSLMSTGCAGRSGQGRAADSLPDDVRTHLLAVADQAAAGSDGVATHVEVARSTRTTATVKTMDGDVGQVGDERPVWAMVITGQGYHCLHSEPPPLGTPSPRPTEPAAHDILLIIDAATYQTTDGGCGQSDALTGLGNTITLR